LARILLVEDDPDVRPMMEHVLLAADYQVEVAVTVAQATALLDRHAYDLVVTDGRLPDGTGIAVADRAKALGVKTLVVTAYGLQFPAAELRRHPYALKPVRAAELLTIIGNLQAA
jgi:DNA-binding response OmpR family regulator